jgi:O-acetylserine/cysteine efflux transporter
LQGWLAVAYVAFISTVLGFSIWGALLSRHPAAAITPFALLIPVVGLSVAALVLGETVTPGRGRRGRMVVLAGLALAVLGGRTRPG